MATADVPARRSQANRRADSRALILDAAVDVLVERGYHGTTTVAIQERAGITRGRLLHHFPSRDAVLVAAAHHLASERILEMERWFARTDDPDPGGAARIDSAIEHLWNTFRQPYFWAAISSRSASSVRAGPQQPPTVRHRARCPLHQHARSRAHLHVRRSRPRNGHPCRTLAWHCTAVPARRGP